MMSAICIDRRVVCAGHDFEGMTLEYFWNFLLTEYIPAFADELSEEEIRQIHQGIENKQSHIFIGDIVNPQTGRHRFSHSFVYANPFFFFSKHPEYVFDGF